MQPERAAGGVTLDVRGGVEAFQTRQTSEVLRGRALWATRRETEHIVTHSGPSISVMCIGTEKLNLTSLQSV